MTSPAPTSAETPSQARHWTVRATAMGLAAAIALVLTNAVPSRDQATAQTTGNGQEQAKEPAKQASWSAAAPGRIEPRNGVIELNAATIGRVDRVWVKPGDRVVAGQPLVKIEDDDLLSRLRAAEADVEARKKNRSTSGNSKIKRRRDAEDELENAYNELEEARRAFDDLAQRTESSTVETADLSNASTRLLQAETRLREARTALRGVINEDDAASPTNGELALTSARSQRDLALAALNKMRVRSPTSGTVLNVNVKPGEIVAPQMREPLIRLGDISALRVKAEVDERDVAEVRENQKVLIRADAFEGRDFKGTVTRVGRSLQAARLGGRDVQRPANSRVLEVIVDVESGTPLLSGMEVDVLFLSNDEAPTN